MVIWRSAFEDCMEDNKLGCRDGCMVIVDGGITIHLQRSWMAV